MKSKLPLAGIQVKNFRAVQDSKAIRFTPLTVFIGNNGSGKSSIVDALETFQLLALYDIDEAMRHWHGFEHIWNKFNALRQSFAESSQISQQPAVRGIAAITDAVQIETIRAQASGVSGFIGKLKYWDYKEVLQVHEALESVCESINSLGLVPQGFWC